MRDRSNRRIELGLAAAAAVLPALWIVGCASHGPPNPKAAYRADILVTITPDGAEPISTEVIEKYHQEKRRRETQVDGEPIVSIDRPDLRITWILHPDSKTFDEIPISDEAAEIRSLPNPFGLRSKGAFDTLGVEVLDGVEATKYAVEGNGISGFAWLRRDRIPLRFRGTMTTPESVLQVDLVYDHIELGRQPAYDFAIPQNYAGFETRKKPRSASVNMIEDVDAAKRRLEQQQRQTRPPGLTY